VTDTPRTRTVLEVVDRGIEEYGATLEFQERTVGRRRAGEIPDTLILVEHLPVYTLGRDARPEHILAAEEELKRRGIGVYRVSRGGDVTYHGPGQLVAYPILDLGGNGKRVLRYVRNLEETIIRALARFGVRSGRDPDHRGVWIGNAKIAAVGVRVTGRVTMHGFALNVSTDLAFYDSIVPCGLRDKAVTSLRRLRPEVTMAEVKAAVVDVFREVFGYGAPGADGAALPGERRT
jgi:lipoate-protein ligase B